MSRTSALTRHGPHSGDDHRIFRVKRMNRLSETRITGERLAYLVERRSLIAISSLDTQLASSRRAPRIFSIRSSR